MAGQRARPTRHSRLEVGLRMELWESFQHHSVTCGSSMHLVPHQLALPREDPVEEAVSFPLKYSEYSLLVDT